MPKTIEGKPVDEKLWNDAKLAVKKQYPELSEDDDQFWALVMSIYKKMAGISSEEGERLGRNGGNYKFGPGGECVCPNCGYTVPHETGVPCNSLKCPKCGSTMQPKIEAEKNENIIADKRPPKEGWEKCIAAVSDWADDPEATCGAIYYHPETFKPDAPEVGKALKRKFWGSVSATKLTEEEIRAIIERNVKDNVDINTVAKNLKRLCKLRK